MEITDQMNMNERINLAPNYYHGVCLHIANGLKAAREHLANKQFDKARPLIDCCLQKLLELLACKGITLDDPVLALYYAAKLMKKFCWASKPNLTIAGKRSVVQVLIFDSDKTHVLLQKRGPYKRQFADCDCVTANGKRKESETVLECAVRVLKDEVGITVDAARLKTIGAEDSYLNHLTCCNFYAFSESEEKVLSNFSERFCHNYNGSNSLQVHYNPTTRCLNIFTTKPEDSGNRFISIVNEIKSSTKIPYIFLFSNTDDNSLVVYQLKREDEDIVESLIEKRCRQKRDALAQFSRGANKACLKALDSDEMHFEPWLKVRCESRSNPDRYAEVLTGAYFPNDAVWAAMGFELPPHLLDISDPAIALISVAGGKGVNTSILTKLAETTQCFRTPPTVVLTTLAFEDLVLSEPAISDLITKLDQATSANKRRFLAEDIRTKIKQIELPSDLVQDIEATFEQLGSDIAVRSSATFEDLAYKSAAGQAETFLHQTNVPNVLASIKGVWASLYSEGFIKYRLDAGQVPSRARMAVLLQKFINPRAAGVVHSFDQDSGRPGYRIVAQPGAGEGVVQGQGKADTWLVGLLCDYILDRCIPTKSRQLLPTEDGGLTSEKIDMTSACLKDHEVLRLADSVRLIHEYYVCHALAADIDVEYAFDYHYQINILQARSKCSTATVNSEGKPIACVATVDINKVPEEAKMIQLPSSSYIAVEGAVKAVLQIDYGRNVADCLPGRILVAYHTNNEYNDRFGSLAGVITTDGNQTSHAAQHAYEKKIPCVVGAEGAFDALKVFDGKLVTFDSGKKRVYLGAIPIIEEERKLDIWLFNKTKICSFADEGSRHENFRPWWESKRKRPIIFVEDFEGHFRRRSNTYKYFQLDYFYKAWDRLTDFLNNLFCDRTPQILKAQARQIKVVNERHSLLHEVKDDDPDSIYYYLRSISDFEIPDLDLLFEERLNGFRDFAKFVHGLGTINQSNVETLVDKLVGVFVWMHFGFWLDSMVEDFASHQLKYINTEASFHNILRDESITDDDRTFCIDPKSSYIPRGRVLNLSRERDKEIYALLEEIRANSQLFELFALDDPKKVQNALREKFPTYLDTIEAWSMKYKLTLEDLDVLSDTEEYIASLQQRLKHDNTINKQLLTSIFQDFSERHPGADTSPDAIKEIDRRLYLLGRGFSRQMLAAKMHKPLADVSSTQIEKHIPWAIDQLCRVNTSERTLLEAARRELDRYGDLKRILRISRLQFPLREDAHHLIVPHQRRIAHKMIDSAAAFVPEVLPTPQDVFNISTDEYIALFLEPDPRYIALTLKRWPMLLKAEQQLKTCWSVTKADFVHITDKVDDLWEWLSREDVDLINRWGSLQDKCRVLTGSGNMPLDQRFESIREEIFATLKRPLCYLASGIRAFEACVTEVVQILEEQRDKATLPRVKKSYAAEKERLLQRVERLKQKAHSEGRM